MIVPQQLTVTAANASGDSIYDLSLTTSSTGALISAIQALNTDGGKHGSFDALVWSPNAYTGTLDLIVADATKGQILRYAGPNYGTSSVIFSYTIKGSGPAYPAGLAVDGAGNLLVISPSSPLNATPALWVVPFNKTTGVWSAPVLIDDTFSGVRTLALAEVLVASTAATPDGNAAPAWNIGDVLVLVGDTFDSRVIVYSQAAVNGVLAKPKVPLTGPTSTVVTSKEFLSLIAAPFGMDIWPADKTHGVSLLFTTIDGRIIRFDTKQNAFTSNFASGLGLGLMKLKVGMYAGLPYAFVAQLAGNNGGEILQFAAPPASGANKPVASVSKGVSEPVGLALVSSGSAPVSSCVAPSTCSPLGPQFTTQISGPGSSRIPPGATILQQSCTVPTDPRVAVTGGVWSCLGPTINVCGTTPTPGCVPATLDVANYCPGFPSTILPATLCGHSGPNGASFQVIKGTAELLDENANDIYIQNAADPTVALPGPYDLGCQQGLTHQFGQIVAFAPRSDLRTIEGTIVEDMTSPYFVDITGYCDTGGGNSHVASMFAFGLGLNEGASGLGTGPTNGPYGFVNTKFINLNTMIQDAFNAQQIAPQSVATTLESYVTQAQTYFQNDYNNDVNDYSCALNTIASADVYLRNEATGTAFSYMYTGQLSNANPNPAGEIDSRLANLYQSISGDFLLAPNPSWPTVNVPPCVTLTVSSPLAVGSSGTLTYGPPAAASSLTLIDTPTQCTLQASDGTYVIPATVPYTGTTKTTPTGTLTTAANPYVATLQCGGVSGDSASSFATTSGPVSSQPPPPTLKSIAVTPQGAVVPVGSSAVYTATGTYSDGSSRTLNPNTVIWSTSSSAVATVSNGVATCIMPSATYVSIGATVGTVSGYVGLQCTAGPTSSVTVTPANPVLTAGTTQQFTATGYDSHGDPTAPNYFAWSSSNPQIPISSNGAVTCGTDGTSTITATIVGSTVSGSTTLTCASGQLASLTLPATESVPVGGTYQYHPIGMDGSGNVVGPGTVTWASTYPAIASVSGGLASCLSAGSTTVTATSGSVVSNGSVLTCTVQTTYQYTGNNFSTGYINYTTSDKVIASMTLTAALPPNASNIQVASLPGFSLTMSDGVQTLTTTAPSATSLGVESLGTVSTDGSGNITIWSLVNRTPPGVNTGNEIGTQYNTVAGEGANDYGYMNLGTAENCYAPPGGPTPDCGVNGGAQGSWTSTSVQNLHVVFGTTSGTDEAAGQLYEVTFNTAGVPQVSTVLSETPEPATCIANGASAANEAAVAISSLAFVPNASTGGTDLVGSNGSLGDVFLMSGPSYQPSTDVTNASVSCANGKGPINVTVAANAGGDMLGVGIETSAAANPGLYYFPPNQADYPNFIYIDSVNYDASLTGTCNGGLGASGAGCVRSLADTVIAPNPVPGTGVAAGDMLVLVGDSYAGNLNPVVMRFPAAQIQLAKGCASGTTAACTNHGGGSQLITQAQGDLPAQANQLSLAGGESPVSMDISPLDGSIFIATSVGNIYQLIPNALSNPTSTGYAAPVLYASGQNGIQKIRVGVMGGALLVFATVQNGSANALVEFMGTKNLPLNPSDYAPLTIGTPAGLAVH